VRTDRRDPLRTASWDEALDAIATAVRESQRKYGPDSVGCFGGGLTNEKAYQLGKFARVALRTSAIDYNGRFCMSSAATAANRAFGVDRGLPFPLADIAEADAILLVGSNPADTMPPAMQYFDAGRSRGCHPHRRRPAPVGHRPRQRHAPPAGPRHRSRLGEWTAAHRGGVGDRPCGAATAGQVGV
jgi:assimilatory nitrate reductase catalytic subunit